MAKRRKNTTPALDLQQQVLYALTDLRLHQVEDPSEGMIEECVKETERRVSSLDSMNAPRWERRFAHFVSYGARYYAYIFATYVARIGILLQ